MSVRSYTYHYINHIVHRGTGIKSIFFKNHMVLFYIKLTNPADVSIWEYTYV